MTIRTLMHITVGDKHWTPTTEDLDNIVKSFKEALVSDTAVVATRNGVELNHTIIDLPKTDRYNFVHVAERTESDIAANVYYTKFPVEGSHWKHHRGGIYTVITTSNLESTDDRFVPTVVYAALKDGYVWSRPLDEWYDSFKPFDEDNV